jgi:hypothetical protein
MYAEDHPREDSVTGQEPALNGEQCRVLQFIYDKFRERGTWVTFAEVDRPLRRLGLKPDKIIESVPRDLLLPFQAGRLQPIPRDELQLSLKGIATCEGGQADIDHFLRLLPWLTERELNFDPDDNAAGELLQVTASEIKEFLELPGEEIGVVRRLRQIIGLQRWGWSGGESTGGEWYVQVGRDIGRFAQVHTLDDYLEVMAKWEEEGKRQYVTIPDDFYGTVPGIPSAEDVPQPAAEYVSAAIIAGLESAAAQSAWDCGKLLQLIRELNDNYAGENIYSAHAMLRAILDHVPPLFGCRGFAEVVSNCSWSQADRRYFRRLLDFKEQGHDVLHRQINRRPDVITIEDMPQRVTVNRLLQECADRLMATTVLDQDVNML